MSLIPSSVFSAAATGLDRVGMLTTVSRVASRAARNCTFQILTYHRVNDDNDPFFPSLPVSVFEAQMRHVAKAYTVLPVEELVDRVERGGLPAGAIAITFDDGYRDNLTCAAPVVARCGLSATIFLATGFIGSKVRPWFDQVATAFKTTSVTSAELPWGRVHLERERDRLAALEIAWARLKRTPEAEFDKILSRLLDALLPFETDSANQPRNGMLDWDEVGTLSSLGFTIGAHTVTHPILSEMSTARARREIEDCREMIRAATGRAPRAFAYPNGTPADYTDDVVRLVREAGFTCAVTTRFGTNSRTTSPWELRRGGPWEHHLPTFALKLAGYRFMVMGPTKQEGKT